MKKLYKASIWQSATGKWQVNCVDDLAGYSGKWWVPCRILGLSPVDFIILLKDTYHASDFHYNMDRDVLLYSWDKYSDAHNFQLMLNKVAKQKGVFI